MRSRSGGESDRRADRRTRAPAHTRPRLCLARSMQASNMSAVLPTPLDLQPRRGLLLGATGWTAVIAVVLVITIGIPILNLAVSPDSAFHVSDYTVSLAGKILCYAICALAMDLIWG